MIYFAIQAMFTKIRNLLAKVEERWPKNNP
jgi:hypothetical protein